MSLTKEMINSVTQEVELLDNNSLLVYYRTHKDLNNKYPNSFFKFKVETAFNEILNRGIEDERTM
jgi:hypothetical protein